MRIGTTGIPGLLKNRDIRLCIIGSLVSAIGDCFNDIAILSFVYLSSGSVGRVSWVYGIVYIAMFLASPLLGAVNDKFNKRKILFVSSLIQFLLIATMIAIPRFPVILACLFLETAFVVLVKLAIRSTLKISARDDELIKANSLSASVIKTVKILSPALAGSLMALWPRDILLATRIALGVDAVSFLVSAFVFLMLSKGEIPAAISKRSTIVGDIGAGYSHLRQNRRIMQFYGYSLLVTVAGTIPFLIKVPFVMTTMGGDASALGMANSFAALGAVIGASLVTVFMKKSDYRIFFACRGLQGICFMLLGATAGFPLMYLLFMAQAMMQSVSQIAEETYQQEVLDANVLGRVSSLYMSANAVTVLVMLRVGIRVDEAIGPRNSYLAAGLWFAIASALFWLVSRRKEIRER